MIHRGFGVSKGRVTIHLLTLLSCFQRGIVAESFGDTVRAFCGDPRGAWVTAGLERVRALGLIELPARLGAV